MKLFNNIIPMATQAYSFAKTYKESIEHEISLYYEPLLRAYEQSLIRFDTSTLTIVPLSAFLLKDERLGLKEIIKGKDFNDLKTVEAKALYQDVSIFLLLRDDIYNTFDFIKAIDLINEYKPFLDITNGQLSSFKQWADFYMSFTMLPDALKSGYIIGSEIHGIPVADTIELSKFYDMSSDHAGVDLLSLSPHPPHTHRRTSL
jgi:hypothetical protein